MSELNESEMFLWSLPELLKRKAQAQAELFRARSHLQELETPQQHSSAGANEVWTHPGHTRADRNRERKQRAENFSREQQAKQRAEKRLRLQQRGSGDDSDFEEDHQEGAAVGRDDETDKDHARAGRRRHKSVMFIMWLPMCKSNTLQATLPNDDDFVSVGDYVLFRFDKQTRKQDRTASNYQLPLCIGRVEEIVDDGIEVWWMYSKGKDFTHGWHLWRTKTRKAGSGNPYKTIMGREHVLVDSYGMAARLSFTSRRTGPGVHAQHLDSKSISVIGEILGADSFSGSSSASERR